MERTLVLSNKSMIMSCPKEIDCIYSSPCMDDLVHCTIHVLQLSYNCISCLQKRSNSKQSNFNVAKKTFWQKTGSFLLYHLFPFRRFGNKKCNYKKEVLCCRAFHAASFDIFYFSYGALIMQNRIFSLHYKN